MGDHKVEAGNDISVRVKFIKHLLDDILALEEMLQTGKIESGITSIGSEQEFCLINENWRPSKKALQILKDLNDEHFTTELAQYNLEINLDPVELRKDCFSQVEGQLNYLLHKAHNIAANHGSQVLLTGILPTISMTELKLDYMTPSSRYEAINNMLKELRGGDFELHLYGVDELSIIHDSVLFEACNTSFQMHLQISPEDFISSYNWSQAIAGPVLGICANSPLLLGRELWSETRIALFRQSIDLRSSSYALQDKQPRVTFGDDWAKGSIAEIFKNDIARYKIILSKSIKDSSLELLRRKEIPKLEALNLHNGSVYRWNRPCYGLGGGKSHVRIENRYIPAGPTVLDEMANFAFWVGLMVGRPSEFNRVDSKMDFRDAKANFVKAARTGKETVLNWCGELISVRDLVLNKLLPIAQKGLEKYGVDQKDIQRFLEVIEGRAKSFNGAQWKVKNYRLLNKKLKKDDALIALTASLYGNQISGTPVHQWPNVDVDLKYNSAGFKVQHVMSTQLFTVNENDLANLAVNVMKWKKIHHVPVENNKGDLCGLLTWSHMKDFLGEENNEEDTRVQDIMVTKLHTTHPEVDIKEAINLMKKNKIGCLPVVEKSHLVGIVTIVDLIQFDNGKG